ncbi:MAG: hypothetical protein ABI135_12490 [Rhodoferax sp.]
MTEALSNGEVLAVFPEGTTGDGMALQPFHANLIQAAFTARAPTQPLLLHYVDAATGRPSHAPSYVGDETLGGSFWRARAADLRAAITGLTRDLCENVRPGSGSAPREGNCHALP